MSAIAASKFDNFVDRVDEMRQFEELLSDPRKSVMVVWGEDGLGKTTLLAKMIHELSARELRKVEIVWTDTRNYDYLGLMRKCRDDLGAAYFATFTTEVNRMAAVEVAVRVEGNVEVATHASFVNSNIGNITAVSIHDNMFNLPAESQSRASERMMVMTDAFLRDASAFLMNAPKPIVIFLDAVNKMSLETHKWLWGELLASIRDGRLSGLKVVVCGSEQPPRQREFADIVQETELRPLSIDDICEYLKRRGIPNATRDLAKMLIASRGSKPADVAGAVDAFMQMQ